MREQTARRLGAGMLGGLMLMGTAVPAFADNSLNTIPRFQNYTANSTAEYTAEQLADNVVEFGEVDFLVHRYNNTVISNRHTYNNLRDVYEDSKDSSSDSGPTGDYGNGDNSMDEALYQIEQGILGYENSIKQLTIKMSTTTNVSEKAALETQIATLKNTIATMEVQKSYIQSMQQMNNSMSDMMSAMPSGGMSASDLRNYYLQFSQAEATMIKTAQSMYPTYYQLMYNLEQLNANLEVAQIVYQGTLVRKDLGMCVQNDVTDALANITFIRNSITSLEKQIVSLKQEFCKLIGRSYSEDVTFGELPAIDYDYIVSIDIYQDINQALDNSYSVRIRQNAMTGTAEDSYESRKADQFALNADRDNVRTSLSTAHSDIQTKQIELTEAKEKLTNAEHQLKQSEEQYTLGLISKLEYEQKKLSYVSEKTACKTAETALFDAVNTYRWTLAGL